jgi:hypothetical protein
MLGVMANYDGDVPTGGVERLEKSLLSFLQRKVNEGFTLLKRERAYEQMPTAIEFVEGKQEILRSRALSKVYSNRIRKIALEVASALTDVRPIWNYETYVPEFKKQADILTKLAKGWWKNGAVDRKLQSILLYAACGGSGYGVLAYNPDLPGGGDIDLVPYDPRDVIPIDPVYSGSIQGWRGVCLRERLPIQTVASMFPEKAALIGGGLSSWMTSPPRDAGGIYSLMSPTYAYASNSFDRQVAQPKGIDLMRIFIKDERVNTSDVEIQMGDPMKNWSYKVPYLGQVLPNGKTADATDAKMYPRGRLIVCTPTAILSDGPNPYWHGMFPVIRFTLDPLPWSLLGASILGDEIPLQNAINEGLRGVEDGMAQWIKRGVIADKTAMSSSNMEKLDTRRPGLKALINPGSGESFQIVPGPELPNWYLQMLDFMINQMDDNSGVKGMQQLAQVRQLPSADSMEKYMEALSPLLRLRARSIEVALGEVAELLKVNFFQYYTIGRRMQILGNDGMALEDFDYDPGSLVPQESPDGDPRDVRAQRHHRNFTFSVAPNSFLNISHTTHKMMIMQLLRSQLCDPWTAWETLNVANIGQPPAETVPERIIAAKQLGLMPGPPPEVVQAMNAMQMAQAQAAIAQASMMMPGAMQQGGGQPPPGGGAPGGAPAPGGNPGSSGPQGGRPSSGAEPPQFVQKDGGARTVVSESGK